MQKTIMKNEELYRRDLAYREACRLAENLWEKLYSKESSWFSLCDSTAGVLTQIDNMVAGLLEKIENKKTADVRIMPGEMKVNPDALLEMAKKADLKDVVIMGWDADDSLFVSGTMAPNSTEMIGTIEIAKDWLLHEASDR